MSESDVVSFYPEGLLHKFGFGDGDMLVDFILDNELDVDFHDLLIAAVEKLVLPRLDQKVETYTIQATLHNPIRAQTIEGEEADRFSVLTPDVIEVEAADLIRVAATLERIDLNE